MSAEERRLMRRIDEEILAASPGRLAELRALDIKTQMSGASFYETVADSGALERASAPRAKRSS